MSRILSTIQLANFKKHADKRRKIPQRHREEKFKILWQIRVHPWLFCRVRWHPIQ